MFTLHLVSLIAELFFLNMQEFLHRSIDTLVYFSLGRHFFSDIHYGHNLRENAQFLSADCGIT